MNSVSMSKDGIRSMYVGSGSIILDPIYPANQTLEEFSLFHGHFVNYNQILLF